MPNSTTQQFSCRGTLEGRTQGLHPRQSEREGGGRERKALTVAPSPVPNLRLEPLPVLPWLVPPEATKSHSGPEDHLPAEAAGGAGLEGAGLSTA